MSDDYNDCEITRAKNKVVITYSDKKQVISMSLSIEFLIKELKDLGFNVNLINGNDHD